MNRIQIEEMTQNDLELLLSWRSHPDAYKFFKRQNGPLVWRNHINFWNNRKNRSDYIVKFHEDGFWRKIGHIAFTDLDKKTPEIGILIGEITLHGQGLGSIMISETLKLLQKLGYSKAKAIIHETNISSQKVFMKNGFKKVANNTLQNGWHEYICNL